MKDLETLKKEQLEMKGKLSELVDFINSEKYYELSENKRKILQNKKVCLEYYLGVLNLEIYEDIESVVIPDMTWMSMLSGMFSSGFGKSTFRMQNTEQKKEEDNILKLPEA